MIFSKASRLNERGRKLADKGWFTEAEEAYRAAADAAPEWSVPWYNLALMHKYLGNWEASLESNQRAVDLSPDDADSWWNLGIAATALGRWDVARLAWKNCDISVPAGDGPIEMNLGHVPIRLNASTEGEVVWSRRIDPARAVLVSVPLPSSGHHWGDLVLHDGAANGHRMLDGRKVPVFDELAILQHSAFVTFIAELKAEPNTVESLSLIADDLGGAAEDWSTTTMAICRECSEGTPRHLHDAEHATPGHPHCGIAARDEAHVQEILNEWIVREPGSSVIRIERPQL